MIKPRRLVADGGRRQHGRMLQLSHRVQQIKPSATLAITAKAAELRAAGRDIISLSVGEPEFDTPPHVCSAAKAAIDAGFTRYTAVPGIPELRRAIADKFRRDNGLECKPDEVLVSSGGKQCIYNLMQALLDAGDEVIIPAPYWVSYPDMALLAEAVPVIVATEADSNFKLKPEQLAQAITAKTRLLMLNSPSNPTGMAYSAAELRALGEVLAEHEQVAVASDEIYEKILFADEDFACFAAVNPELRARTITLNGVSKAYCMTGWRIGYCTGPEHLIKAMSKIQSQSTSNPCAISQKAALAALTGPQDSIQTMVDAYRQRSRWLVAKLNSMDGVSCLQPDGAFYVFPSIKALLGKATPAGEVLHDDVALCAWLLEEAGVALVPGTAFGAPGFVRISYAVSQASLEDAVNRIAAAVEKLT